MRMPFSKRQVKKFLMIVGTVVGVYAMITAVVVTAMLAAQSSFFAPRTPVKEPDGLIVDSIPSGNGNNGTANNQSENGDGTQSDDDEGFLKPPSKTNFLIYGLDSENVLTDIILVGCFERDTGKINMLSIPRDTYTRISESRLARMREDGLKPPSSGVLKINALRSYGGRTYGIGYLMEQIGEMLGITFHYYVEMDLGAFRKIVDLLGGVRMEIPAGGLYYDDPEQNLHIAIPGGWQELDGEMAEGLVRYRHSYENGDLDRITVQQSFMKQLFQQVLTRETIMRDPLAIANIAINYIKTNIGIDLVRYIPYVDALSADKIAFFTLPGEGAYVGGVAYFLPDNSKVSDVVNQVFYAAVGDAS